MSDDPQPGGWASAWARASSEYATLTVPCRPAEVVEALTGDECLARPASGPGSPWQMKAPLDSQHDTADHAPGTGPPFPRSAPRNSRGVLMKGFAANNDTL